MKKQKRHLDNHLMLERLCKIHAKIKSGCYPNCQQLAYDNEVSIATINRDIEFLRDRFGAGDILEYNAVHRGYHYKKDFEMPLNMISSKDIVFLSLAKQLLAQYEGSPVHKEISSIINFLSESRGLASSDFIKRIAIPPLPKTTVNEEVWNAVIKAMQEKTVLKFDYNGRWNTSTTHRVLRPYQVLLQDGLHFVFGYDQSANGGKGGERLFNLSRMKNVANTSKTFKLPKDFDYASRCGGGRFGAFSEAERVQYEIEFYDGARQYAKDCVWADDQEFEDYDEDCVTVMRFSSSQATRVLEWILSQGVNAKPIAPAKFVERWKKEVLEMAKYARG